MGVTLVVLLFFLWYCFLRKNDRVKQPYTKMEQLLQETSMQISIFFQALSTCINLFRCVIDKKFSGMCYIIYAKLVMVHGDQTYTSQDIIKRIETLDDTDIIGSGGFGTVYKLVMDDNSAFAVNKILNNRETYSTLEWSARLKIAIGAARGLAYLHHDCYACIVHRDVKSSNILLGGNLESHVSDFGPAKLLEDDETHVTTIVARTFGYLAPEYLQSGRATEKSDVYSVGIVLLELLSNKRPIDQSFVIKGLNVVGWVNTILRENRLEEIVDTHCDCTCKENMEVVLQIIVRCIGSNPEECPTMNQVAQMLEADTMSPCPSDFYVSNSE